MCGQEDVDWPSMGWESDWGVGWGISLLPEMGPVLREGRAERKRAGREGWVLASLMLLPGNSIPL